MNALHWYDKTYDLWSLLSLSKGHCSCPELAALQVLDRSDRS